MARTNPRTLAALANTAAQAIEALAAIIEVDPPVWDALALVARAARGERTEQVLAASAKAVEKLANAKRDWRTPARKDYAWTVGAVAYLAGMAANGADYADVVLAHLGYGLDGGNGANRVTAWYAAAFAAAVELSTDEFPRRIDPVEAAAEETELARVEQLLAYHGSSFANGRVRHKASLGGAPDKLVALLQLHRFPIHASVLAFDAAFSGLIIPPKDARDDWFEKGYGILVGAYACISRDPSPRGGRDDLVPVAYTLNDCVAFLDEAGRAYLQDTFESAEAVAWAESGTAAVARLLAWD